ncbi:MAG TPA: pyridoxal phosphate-dependent aminotransferase family protein [Candidatus Margulisiibacteriota bacterium]|nr:pyridoxal phosphate-dependent aminotransferase family protein [Candidatus Margulisiibacteriota bacterium]
MSATEAATAKPTTSNLLDIEQARMWFELLEAGDRAGVYTFQIPFGRATTPWSTFDGREVLVFSSYSYLGLATHPRVIAASKDAIDRYGTSTGGVRMLTGSLDLHFALEEELAQFVGQEAAITFSSGYTANCAAVGPLFEPQSLCILDQFAHQSLQAAVKLSGARMEKFQHNDIDSLRSKLAAARAGGVSRILVIVDGVFSMDGDQPPLKDLIALKNEFEAFLLVDESHALGAVGPTGRGSWEAQGVSPRDIDILTGALSKGIPATGGFIAGSAKLVRYLQHAAPPYIFSAALAPSSTAAVRAALEVLQSEPQHIERLHANAALLRDGLTARNFAIGKSMSPVVPLLLGDEWRAYSWSRRMLDRSVATSAVSFPAVQRGAARLRLCATANHTPEHFERLFEALEACRAEEGA